MRTCYTCLLYTSQHPLGNQIQRRADAGRGRQLDGAEPVAVDVGAEHADGIGLFFQPAVAVARGLRLDDDDVLLGGGNRGLEDVLEQVAACLLYTSRCV